ncbi:MAG: DNA-processing protein DprA [Fusicatenibacter sp.]|nr:DNA-processing protein DprA [Fusicatenibacter sp.]
MRADVVYYDRGCEGYPKRLMPYKNMPDRLYSKGAVPSDEKPTVAIVGARMCSAYGRSQALRFARVLSEHGVQIISGLAYGIDALAHRGALNGGGATFAVLGCGADICYPKENYPLLLDMLEHGGGILTEFPHGDPPRSWHFPLRNRVISALSDVVLIIEAKEKSGSLITADYALEQGKTIFALPGRVNDQLSAGCNRLIAQGASIALSPTDVLEELGIAEKAEETETAVCYSKEPGKIMAALQGNRLSMAELQKKTGLEFLVLTQVLLRLELEGRVVENPPGWYEINRENRGKKK